MTDALCSLLRILGAMAIRAYGKVQDFMLQSEDKVDNNQACYYPSMVANRSEAKL